MNINLTKKTMKTILILGFLLNSKLALADCALAPDMGKNFLRCDNREAICYIHIEGRAGEAPISCFRK